MQYVFKTMLDFDYLNEIFEKISETKKFPSKKIIEKVFESLDNFNLPLIKKFNDDQFLLRFLKKKKIYRKMGSYFTKKVALYFLYQIFIILLGIKNNKESRKTS